jgi:epoxyqueuosine reductase
MTMKLKNALQKRALENGFDVVRITTPHSISHVPEQLNTWLEQGFAGTMDWMHDRVDQRGDPRLLWPQVKSIVMLGLNYGSDMNPLKSLENKEHATLATYAQRRDYHDVIKGKLKQLAGWLAAHTAEQVKVFVDTAPVMEKALAQASGLGWQGKHTVLVSREWGNWLFLGAIYTSALLDADTPETDHCGSCQKCLDICPTKAFPAPYVLDSRRCISYLTIEHKEPIDRALRPLMGNRVFGCDDCLAVCPWNKFAHEGQEAKLQTREAMTQASLAEMVMLDDAAFRTFFAGTPVKRTGRARFIRNVLIAIGNSGATHFAPLIEPLLCDPEPLVRGACVWALARLISPESFLQIANLYCPQELHDDVCQEWNIELELNRTLFSH